MVVSAEGPSAEPSSAPSLSSMPSSVPSIDDGSQGRRLSNLTAQSFKKSRTLIGEFSDHNITDNPLPEVVGSDLFNNSYGQSTTPSVTGDDPSPPSAPPSCQELPFTFTYSINYAASAGSNARKVITHFIKARNGKQTDLYSELGGGDVEVAIASPSFVFNTTETIKICSDDSVYKR
jgi:hypothetical protein